MPPSEQGPAMDSSMQGAGDMQPAKSLLSVNSVVLITGVVALAVLGGLYWMGYFTAATPQTTMQEEPKTIGVAHFRQQFEAFDGLKAALAEMGYTNVTYIDREVVVGPTMVDEYTDIMREFVNMDVDLIWVSFEVQAKVAVDITAEMGRSDIPIVFLSQFHDPVDSGIVASFQSSGNNATGVVVNLVEVAQRSLSFIKEIHPDATRVGIFGTGFMVPGVGEEYFGEFVNQAPRFGLEVVEYTTNVPPPEVGDAFHTIAATIESGDIDALVHIPGHFYDPQEGPEYQEIALRLGIVQNVPWEDLPGGGHFAYSPVLEANGRQSAVMVDKIFKGTLPSDIPVEYGERNALTLHMGRAAETGIEFPSSMLFIADERREE